jgi:calcineurin-like phosphoesterase family protein
MFITSDTHWGHANIIRFCWETRKQYLTELGDVDAWKAILDAKLHNDTRDSKRTARGMLTEAEECMSRRMIDIWNTKVSNDDLVIHLGDFSFYSKQRTMELIDRLNGDLLWIRGNHDPVDLPHYDIFEMTAHCGTKVVMCHYPMLSWNGMHHGSIMLHGHTHGSAKRASKRMDVGMDATGSLLSEIDVIVTQLSSTPHEP